MLPGRQDRVRPGHFQSLLVDGDTAAAVRQLQARSIEPLLLKGPAIAAWLYTDDSSARTYCDIDLVVAPADRAAARTVLADLGYRMRPLGRTVPPPHAETWVHPEGRSAIDLHRTLHELEHVDEDEVWAFLRGDADVVQVGGVHVACPGLHARLLHVALHYSPKNRALQAGEDIRRAVSQTERSTWEAVCEQAVRFGVADWVSAALRDAGAAALADDLGLPNALPPRTALRWHPDRWANKADQVISQPTTHSRLVATIRQLTPSPNAIRSSWPAARRNRTTLILTYVGRIVVRVPQVLFGAIRRQRWYRDHDAR